MSRIADKMSPNANFFDKIRDLDDVEIKEKILIDDCFLRFQNQENDALYLNDFHLFLQELFPDSDETSMSDDIVQEMFDIFDLNGDGKIDDNEFEEAWSAFVLPVLKPKCALVVIDVQNDFIDGSLAIRNCETAAQAGQDGLHVVPVINEMLNSIPFHAVVYTYDWHPENHVSFAENVHMRKFHESSPVTQDDAKMFDTVVFDRYPPMEQKLWPRHCVQKSWGSQLHSDLKVVDNAVFIYKGSSPDIDSYSAFWDNQKRSQTNLAKELRSRGITDVLVCGLALDVCVGFTALDALEDGFRTILVEDACRGISGNSINNMKENLISKHAVVVTSDEVGDMITAKKRRPELGYFIAKQLKRNTEKC